MPAAYPILLDVTDRLCVIIGGGPVAIRKARGLIHARARRVHMIAPMFATDIPAGVRQFHEPYRPDHLEGAGLVFAATNLAEVNDAVVRDAHARGILASRADFDDETPGDFVSPARLDQGPVTIAVSAGSAALSVMIRDSIASQWNPAWTALAAAMVELRPEFKQQFDEPTRRKIFRDLATPQAMEIAAAGGTAALRKWIGTKHEFAKHEPASPGDSLEQPHA